MTWSSVQQDWHGFIDFASKEIGAVSPDEASRADGDHAVFATYLSRAADLTADEAEEIVNWRLLPGFQGARMACAAE